LDSVLHRRDDCMRRMQNVTFKPTTTDEAYVITYAWGPPLVRYTSEEVPPP